MSVPPPSVTPISPGEMQLLLSRAGLALNPGQIADLVLAWRQVAGLITLIPHDRPLADDMALAFRLVPPSGGVAGPDAEEEGRAHAKPPARQKRVAGAARQPAKPRAKAKLKAAPAKKRGVKRPAAKSAARKKARRKR